MNDIYKKAPDETNDEFLFRLGRMKETHQTGLTWKELALILNANCPDISKTESYWRKRYHSFNEDIDAQFQEESFDKDNIKEYFREIEKQRVRARDERISYNREVRSQARMDELLSLFKQEITRYDKVDPQLSVYELQQDDKAILVMLSDLHYGMAFDTIAGKYNSEIAKKRLYLYAQKIKEFGSACSTCYIALMGDMISGLIHPGIRIENKENIIEQIVGASELIAEFICDLSSYFDRVYVNSVSGNHSRPDHNLENTLRNERLDSLIPWYCKAKLEQIDNVEFIDNVIDDTVGSFNIFGKLYVTVHGDMEKDVKELKTSASNISKLIGHHVDYMLSGHTHVSQYRFEDTRYIVNGCVCGSGDDYTMKKRLFGPPTQVCMICTKNGVEAIHPVELGGV